LATATATATAMATATDRRMFHVYNNLARFSNYLASFLASAHLEVFQKERKNGPSICTTNTNTQIHKQKNVILYVYLRIGAKSHLFFKTNTQMHHFKVEPSQCAVSPSFAGQRNHSLRL
jgi:hypothetical protein